MSDNGDLFRDEAGDIEFLHSLLSLEDNGVWRREAVSSLELSTVDDLELSFKLALLLS